MIYGILTVLVILAVFAILIWIDERRSWGSDPAAQSLARHHISILEGVSTPARRYGIGHRPDTVKPGADDRRPAKGGLVTPSKHIGRERGPEFIMPPKDYQRRRT